MNERRATAIADLLLVAAGAAAAWIVLRDPARRRAAFRMAKGFVIGPLPALFVHELRAAWEASGRRSIMGR
ncbi:MAG: hypothetical protein HYU53_08830 [Acidobacteria bacterium]|nr:hypothetical protein [Acidobacteriota bacterium]